MSQQGKERMYWIDAAKAVAILAVIIDHSAGILYQSRMISLSTFFSVTVFVFLAGMTSYYSSERHKNEKLQKEIVRKVLHIVVPYAISVGVYQLVIYKKWELLIYIEYLLGFDISLPFYFVFFYLQLVVISPILYRIIKRCDNGNRFVRNTILIIGVTCISIFAIKRTVTLEIYGGGRNLFGGSYLIVYLLGELVAHYRIIQKWNVNKKNVIVSIIIVVLALVWLSKYEFALDARLGEIFGGGLNPPGITLMIYSTCIIICIYSIFSFIESSDKLFVRKTYHFFQLIGKYSFYIFLYHRLVLDYMLIYIDISNIWIKRFVYLFTMIVVPIVIKIIFDKVKKYV